MLIHDKLECHFERLQKEFGFIIVLKVFKKNYKENIFSFFLNSSLMAFQNYIFWGGELINIEDIEAKHG